MHIQLLYFYYSATFICTITPTIMHTIEFLYRRFLYSVLLIYFNQFNYSHTLFDNEINLKCFGVRFDNVTLTTYFPNYSSEEHDDGFTDVKGNPLCTLQDYVDDRTNYVTLSMDENLKIPYGTSVCIPELNNHLGHRIRFEVRDSSSDIFQSGYKRAEICVRSETDSYDVNYNRRVTLIFI
ncbi:uncharacterized protein [Onthophagus taurus]|uniref:uncharacterized protein n=1 Tax=Onthophagus taurus TaxID=166361 RepID=UPI000C20F622|nr:uncharacterized protein LOC111415569 [Onthophagus taurus]